MRHCVYGQCRDRNLEATMMARGLLQITLSCDDGSREHTHGTWNDVRAFMWIVEAGCGYTAVIVYRADGNMVLGTRIPA